MLESRYSFGGIIDEYLLEEIQELPTEFSGSRDRLLFITSAMRINENITELCCYLHQAFSSLSRTSASYVGSRCLDNQAFSVS